MQIPIHNGIKGKLESGGVGALFAGNANIALIYDKYLYEWRSGWSLTDADSKAQPKKLFYDEIEKGFPNIIDGAVFNAFTDRRGKLLKNRKATFIELRTQWRFVSGLGMAHPTENGFVWDRNLGVPFLPGSSVKGMVRAWAEQWGALDDEEEIERIFGGQKSEGTVIFYDAYPTEIPKLKLDIMNVHYKDYYEGKIDKETKKPIPPADYLSPTPIFFLTVAPDQPFSFAVGPSSVGSYLQREEPPYADYEVSKDVDKAIKLLKAAIETLGAGAKTAVGYGRFR